MFNKRILSGLAAAAIGAAVLGLTATASQAFPRHYGWGYGPGYGYGYGAPALGLLAGAALAGPRGYGDDCYYVRSIARDRFGYPHRVRRLVCD